MEHNRGARSGIHAKDSVEFTLSAEDLLMELLEKFYTRVWSSYRGSHAPVHSSEAGLVETAADSVLAMSA